VAGFRTKLLVAMTLVVSAVTVVALFFGQRSLVANVEEELERRFESELAGLQRAQDVRHAALAERCRALVRKQRIRAAFEDNALDLLYPNAVDELRDLMTAREEEGAATLRARFYRFLDATGAVIAPPNPGAVGWLDPAGQAALALPRLPVKPQLGYLVRPAAAPGETVSEIMAMPIISYETGAVIGAIVLGFAPFKLGDGEASPEMKSGVWLEGRLHSAVLPATAGATLAGGIARAVAENGGVSAPRPVQVEGAAHLMFTRRLNPGSMFAPAHEICLYPLAGLQARQRELRWQVLGAGSLLLLLGLSGSHVVAARLSRPVEELAIDSEADRAQRVRAEAALETTSAELQRSARFSADASHQLKTPVTVLRAGLEELLAREKLSPEECSRIADLIHQTYRLSSLIEDLLLLSRMDAGRLKLEFSPVNLSRLIDASIDDLSALPDDLGVQVATDYPGDLHVAGEQRYTAIILQNLLENARKYNRAGGSIRIAAVVEADVVRLAIGNTGRPIPGPAQARIFDRFHRGTAGENVPGYGLGLNLARELARLHQGELRLVSSDERGTEFEVTFRLAHPAVSPA
jgi:signal transduction histidine kinase